MNRRKQGVKVKTGFNQVGLGNLRLSRGLVSTLRAVYSSQARSRLQVAGGSNCGLL
jgi:hypothetical protein